MVFTKRSRALDDRLTQGWGVPAGTLHPEGLEGDLWSDLLPGEEVKWIVRGQGHCGTE